MFFSHSHLLMCVMMDIHLCVCMVVTCVMLPVHVCCQIALLLAFNKGKMLMS